jgi:hypothetical protein
MRWGVITAIAIFIAFAVYFASPVIALNRISSAVEAEDAVALSERIDFNSVKKSFLKQISLAYRELTGKPAPLDAMTRRFAVSVADPLVSRLMTVRALLKLLGDGEIDVNGKMVRTDHVPIDRRSLDSVWHLWLNAEYRGGDFYVFLPPEAPPSEQFRVHLRPIDWRWMVVGIHLPEKVRRRLASELLDVVR